jgi:hypothetical protein
MIATQMQQANQQGPQRNPPGPAHFFETMHAYQRTAALKTAIELDLFTAIASGFKTVSQLAQRCESSERGIRALADFLVVLGFIEKNGEEYCLTADSGIFLDQRSPAYLGTAVRFMASPAIMDGFKDLTAVVRSGYRRRTRDIWHNRRSKQSQGGNCGFGLRAGLGGCETKCQPHGGC